MTTKTKFLAAYRPELAKAHPWARDKPDALDSFMRDITGYVLANRNAWCWQSSTTQAAWRACGCKGRITFKALCALPE